MRIQIHINPRLLCALRESNECQEENNYNNCIDLTLDMKPLNKLYHFHLKLCKTFSPKSLKFNNVNYYQILYLDDFISFLK